MKKLAGLLLVFVLLIGLTACGTPTGEHAAEIRDYCDTFLASTLEGDVDGALAAMDDSATKEQLEPVILQMQTYMDGVTEYHLNPDSYFKGVKNGTAYIEATFKMETNAKTYYVTGTMMAGYSKLYHINIVSAEDKGLVYTGTLDTLEGSNGIQWAFLGLAVLTLAFMIFALVHCCRRKIKGKVLWILFIIGGLLILTAGQGRINFRLGLFTPVYTHMKIYPNGSSLLQLVIPMGAILYFPLHKELKDPAPTEITLENEYSPTPQSIPETQTESPAHTESEETTE